MMSKGQTVSNIEKYNSNMLGNTPTQLAVCKIDKINSDMTVDVTVMSGTSGTKIIHRVRLTSPYRNEGDGIIVMPEVGSLAIVAIISDVYQFIISYLNYSDSSVEDIRNLKEGEYLLKSKQGSYIKFNDNQGIDIHSGSNSAIFIDNDSLSEVTETKTSINMACESTAGVIDNIVQGVEKWYDKDVESEFSNEDIVDSVASLGEAYIELKERKPIIEIQKANVIDDLNKKVKLELYEDPKDNPDACYKLEVSNDNNKFKILIGKDGSMQVEANVLKLKCNNLDLTQSNKLSYSSLNFIER